MVHVTLVANTAESVFGAQAERAGGHLCIQLREQVSVVRATQKRVCKCCCVLTNSPHVSRCYAGPQNRKLGTMGGSRSLDAALDFVEMHLVLLDSFVATSTRYNVVYCVLGMFVYHVGCTALVDHSTAAFILTCSRSAIRASRGRGAGSAAADLADWVEFLTSADGFVSTRRLPAEFGAPPFTHVLKVSWGEGVV